MDRSKQSDGQTPSLATWRVALLCALATFMDGFDIQSLALAVPAMAEDFGRQPTAFTFALTGSLVGMAVGALALAPLADRFGRKALLVSMTLLMGLTTLALAYVSTVAEVTALRAMAGLGLGAIVPVAIAETAESTPARYRTLLVTTVVAFTGLGSFGAGLAAPHLFEWGGWRSVFHFGGILPITIAAMFLVFLPGRGQVRSRANGRSVSQTDSGVSNRGPGGLVSPPFRRITISIWAIFFTNLLANYGLISWLPTVLESSGVAREVAQPLTGLLALGGIIGGLFFARMADLGHAKTALLGGYLLAATAMLGFVFMPGTFAMLAALIFAIGIGAIGTQMMLGSLVAGFYPSNIRTTGIGWSSGMGRIGSIFGPLVLAALMSSGMSGPSILASMIVPILICMALVASLRFPEREAG